METATPRTRERPGAGEVARPGTGAAAKAPDIETTKTVNLVKPINLGGAMTSTLTIRRPSVGDRLRVVREYGSRHVDEQDAIFIGILCDLAPEEVDRLDMVDFNKLSDTLRSFSNSAP